MPLWMPVHSPITGGVIGHTAIPTIQEYLSRPAVDFTYHPPGERFRPVVNNWVENNTGPLLPAQDWSEINFMRSDSHLTREPNLNLLGVDTRPSGWHHRWTEDEKRMYLNGHSEAEVESFWARAKYKRDHEFDWVDRLKTEPRLPPFGKVESEPFKFHLPVQEIEPITPLIPRQSPHSLGSKIAESAFKRHQEEIQREVQKIVREATKPQIPEPITDSFMETFGTLRSGKSITVGTGKQEDRFGNTYFRGTKKIFPETGFSDHTFGASGFHVDLQQPEKKKSVGFIESLGSMFGGDED